MSKRKLLATFGLFALVLPVAAVATAEGLIKNNKDRQKKLFDDIKKIPFNTTGLLMGISKIKSNGKVNPYYVTRINAAVTLFNAGKIKNVLITGDNSDSRFNEPEAMKLDLINRGIPKEQIYVDYGGRHTKDSILRAKEVFGQTKVTIISQKFHNERSLYYAEKFGVDAVAFNAKDIAILDGGFGGQFQERISRLKVLAETFCPNSVEDLGHFEGKKIKIEA